MSAPLEVRVPGDKSVAHRSLIVAALAPESSAVSGLPDAADVRSTAAALAEVGIHVDWPAGSTTARVTPGPWRSGRSVDCGNSGTSARLLTGLFAGLGLEVTVDGDASLRRRPMDRVVYPLQAMGARIAYEGEPELLPIRLAPRASGHLRVLRYRSRVASAQVKSALVLAALAAGVEFEMWEPGRSRDHTERLLRHLGVPIEFGPEERGAHLRLPADGREALRAADLAIPGDPSSAAFLLAAGVLAGVSVTVEDVLLNETRTAYLEALERFGAEVEIELAGERGGEPVGWITAGPGSGVLTAVDLGPDGIPGLIDELPVLAMLAARAVGTTRLRGVGELRVKESDRLAALAEGLETLGVPAETGPDELVVHGRPEFAPSGGVRVRGDHRIAMAFGALGEVPGATIEVDDPACVGVSYPEFWADLEKLRVVGATGEAP
ncbi:MAG: 3-phosphoshikimate 1-carboxyvinyltransferase [Gemmatimonadales bacterium]